MRLIDADLLQEVLAKEPMENRTYLRANEIVVDMPTAYDVDKVSERLRLELDLTDKEKERCAKENPLQFDEAKGYARGIAVALEIIKSAALNEASANVARRGEEMNKITEGTLDCFVPEENNPYPLCVGRGLDICKDCQLRADYEPEDPYGVER